MESEHLTLLCVVIIICVIIGAIAIILNQTEETQIKVLSNTSLYNEDTVTVQLTTENGTPIANQAVNVTLVDANGSRNIQKLVTDDEGKASFSLSGVPIGNYTLECTFGGNDGYNGCNITETLNIKVKEVQQQTTDTTSNNNYNAAQSNNDVKYSYGDGIDGKRHRYVDRGYSSIEEFYDVNGFWPKECD